MRSKQRRAKAKAAGARRIDVTLSAEALDDYANVRRYIEGLNRFACERKMPGPDPSPSKRPHPSHFIPRFGLWSARLASLEERLMPPLSLSDEEKDLLLSLAQPLDQRLRPEFLAAVAAELEANGQAGAVGIGSVHRVARTVQRRFFDPPVPPNAGKMARA